MRLTEKNNVHYDIKQYEAQCVAGYAWNYYDAVDKLGRLEDIEDELGADLLVKLRVEIAIANNIKRNKDTKVFCIGCDGSISEVSFYKFFPPCITVLSSVENQCFELDYRDYGKTWALTKDELNKSFIVGEPTPNNI